MVVRSWTIEAQAHSRMLRMSSSGILLRVCVAILIEFLDSTHSIAKVFRESGTSDLPSSARSKVA
jgi:hypothetical protein